MKVVFNSGKNQRFHGNILTIGKSYDVVESKLDDPYTYYHVLCDDGVERDLLANKFISLEVHRNKIINEILNESNL
jgi:hypothetical protein